MRAAFVVAIALLAVFPASFARIGETAADFQKRYGDPISESSDEEDHWLRLHQLPGFKQIKLIFEQDKSVLDGYTTADTIADNDALFPPRWEHNNHAFDLRRTERPPFGFEDARELEYDRGDGKIRSYSGRLEIKKKAGQNYAVLDTGNAVLEIFLAALSAEAATINAASEATVTVLNQLPEDMGIPTAWVRKRKDLNYEDMTDDVYDRAQTLVKVDCEGKRIYDHSFCAIHQIPMESRNVRVAFAKLALSETEQYCQDHFPHYRDYAVGGWPIIPGDEEKMVSLYICPACVSACNAHKAAHSAP